MDNKDALNALLDETLLSMKVRTAYYDPDCYMDEIIFTLKDGRIFKMHHDQDCLEDVSKHDIVGDIDDLVGSPIIQAEEVTVKPYENGKVTYTFYKFATTKCSVKIRWFNLSNGYYPAAIPCKLIEQ